MNYDEASEFEINMAVAKLEGFRIDKYKSEKNKNSINGFLYRQVKDLVGEDLKNYCNSWEDMGPIIERENISIAFERGEHGNGEWDAFLCDYFGHGDIIFSHCESNKKPLRAAAITYLRNKGQ